MGDSLASSVGIRVLEQLTAVQRCMHWRAVTGYNYIGRL